MDKDFGRDRRQAQMLIEDMDAFDVLEEILNGVSIDCHENNAWNTFADQNPNRTVPGSGTSQEIWEYSTICTQVEAKYWYSI